MDLAQPDFTIPTKRIGPYRLAEEVGRGGMAIVFRAIDLRNEQEVALKVLPPVFAQNEQYLQRFLREGQHAMRLRHPQIVRVLDAAKADSYYYIAMEFIKGDTLLGYMRSHTQLLPLPKVIDILRQVAAGLDYAHAQGFLHRDLKPSNILISHEHRALLADFGVAKHMEEDLTGVTQIGMTIGTPAYMSPEQARGLPLDRRSDIYSLGVVAYSMFTGSLPFKAESKPALLHKIIYEAPLDATAFVPDLPAGIRYVLNRVLAKDPPMRYPTAGAFAEAVAEGETWVPTATAELRAVRQQLPPHPTPDTLQPQPNGVPPATSRRSWRVTLATTIGLITIVFAIYLLLVPATPPTVPNTPASQITLTAFADPAQRFNLQIPTDWADSVQSRDDERLLTFHARDRIASTFIFERRHRDNAPVNAVTLIAAYFRQDLPYQQVQPVRALPLDQLPQGVRYAQEFAATWLDRPVVVQLFVTTQNGYDYILGTAFEVAEQATMQSLSQTILASWQFAAEPPHVAAAPTTATTFTPPLPTSTRVAVAAQMTPIPVELSPSVTAINPITITQQSTQTSPTITAAFTPSAAAATSTATASAPTPTVDLTATMDFGTSQAVRAIAQPPQPTTTPSATAPPTFTVAATSTPNGTATQRARLRQAQLAATATQAAQPTATHTALPTVTSQPTATATTTRQSTSTATSTATLTVTSPPTSTPLRAAPATATPDQAATQQARSQNFLTGVAATLTAQPTVTPTPTAIPTTTTQPPATATPLPTATSAPTATPLPTATVVPTIAPTPIAVLPPPTTVAAGRQVTLVAPPDQSAGNGSILFQWSAAFGLNENECFEVVFWEDGQSWQQGFGIQGAARDTSARQTFDSTLEQQINSGSRRDALRGSTTYNWGVLIVQCSPYQRIELASESRRFTYTSSGGDNSDGPSNPPGSDPRP